MTGHQDPRVDELRARLRSLGYLDAGVDRFVLGAARQRRRPAAIAWLASLRIGVLAAALTGPVAAIGIASGMPELVTGPRDGFVVAIYTGVLFGAAVAVASALATLLAASMRGDERRRRIAALVAGILATAACLAYLTMWWDASTTSDQLRSPGAGWTWLALAVVAGISLLIGHAVTVVALAVSVASGASAGSSHGVPGSSRGVMAAAGALTFCGALLLFNLTSPAETRDAPPPSLTVVPSGYRVRLIAIDGFDPRIARRLAGNGGIPALAAALGLSTQAADGTAATHQSVAALQFDDTTDPARLWTTIATGLEAEVHAVRGLEARRVLGIRGTLGDSGRSLGRSLAAAGDLLRLTRPSLASGSTRRARSFWEVAAGAGLQTAVVNWWATWPAPAGSGIVVTDRAALRLDRGGDLDAEIAPASLYEHLRARWADLQRQARGESSMLTPGADGVLARAAELDALQMGIAAEVAGRQLDLACTYVSGLDIVQHGLLTTAAGTPASALAEKLGSLQRYYEYLDRLLAPALVPDGAELVMVLTSPGRVTSGTTGLFAVRGAAANARARDAIASVSDVAPTILHALGLPISRELQGRALIELFSVEFARRYPVRSVETYGRPAGVGVPRGTQPLDQEMIDRLRSLGYVR